MAKKKISAHVLLGATLLSGVNPAIVEAKTEGRVTSPTIERVVEVEDTEVIKTEEETENKEKVKNKKTVADTKNMSVETVQTEEVALPTSAISLDEWMPDPLLQELVAEQFGIDKSQLTQDFLKNQQVYFDYAEDNRPFYLSSYAGLEYAGEVELYISAQSYNSSLFSLKESPISWDVLGTLSNLNISMDGDLTAIFPQGIDMTDDRIHIDPHNIYFSHDVFLNQTNYQSFYLSYTDLKYLNINGSFFEENTYIGNVYFGNGEYVPKILDEGIEFTLVSPLEYSTLAGKNFINTDDQQSFPDGPYLQLGLSNKYINSRINLHFAMPGGDVTSRYVDSEGNEISDSVLYSGGVGENYTTEHKQIPGYILQDIQGTESGKFTEEPQTITYVYKNEIHEEIQIKDVKLEVNPAIAWFTESKEVQTEMFKPMVIHPITQQKLDVEALEALGFTLRYELLKAPQIGENQVKIIMSNGVEEKEARTVLYLGEPQVRVNDSKFIKASESHDMNLVNTLAQSTVEVVANFGQAQPEKVGLSLEIKDFKATEYDQKNKLTVLVNLGTSSQKLVAEGALNLGEESWELSGQRHYGVAILSPTYQLGSLEHRLASHDTLGQNIRLFQATPAGRIELSTSQSADFLAFKEADITAYKDSNKRGAQEIAFEFGKNEGTLQKHREGQAILKINLVENPVIDGTNTSSNPKTETTYNVSDPRVATHSTPTLLSRSTEQSRQKLGEFGSRDQKILGTMGTLALVGSALLVWLKKRR
ncbi:MucBP domain-containing protein [Lactococcus garvieae]|uniref:MucBP domain-containing protein n=1 Tax=Lactococcus garvieae TaxID=1363 RepID=UPI001E510F45|nr:MucBP domain-containing protein [Lactococcus garvieae]